MILQIVRYTVRAANEQCCEYEPGYSRILMDPHLFLKPDQDPLFSKVGSGSATLCTRLRACHITELSSTSIYKYLDAYITNLI
jgi:hypothetical protein